MSDLATVSGSAENSGIAALARLTDRISTLVPPPVAANLARPQPSPAVRAGLARAQMLSAQAARRARAPRSTVGTAIHSFVAACGFIPYALVGLGLRLLMARIFFLDGQSKIVGPVLPIDIYSFHWSVTLPAQIRADTFTAFLTQYAPLPLPPMLSAYTVSYAEFILPIMLVFGLGTRIAALGMLIMTAIIQIYVLPAGLWTTQIYWFAILTVLVSQGAGEVSLDHIIRFFGRR
jgi:putative oxidoreductase